MSHFITVMSARYDAAGEKVDYLLPADTLEEAFALLDREASFYNFAHIQICHNGLLYALENQHRSCRPPGHAAYVSDRRKGGDRRAEEDRSEESDRPAEDDRRAEGDRRRQEDRRQGDEDRRQEIEDRRGGDGG